MLSKCRPIVRGVPALIRAQRCAFATLDLPLRTQLFINNEWVDAKSKKTFDTFDPRDESKIATVQEAGEQDVDDAVAAAKEAFKTWKNTDGSTRRQLLNKLADLMEENRARLAEVESLDNGKPVHTADAVDVGACIENFRYYAGWCDKGSGQTPVPTMNSSSMFAYTLRQPIGVCGQIIPWNFPLLIDDVQYELKWVDPKQPLVFGFVAEHLQKELTRIAEIKPFVITTAGTLTSENERNTTLKYYQSLTVAYKTVIATIEEAIDTLPAPVENPGDEFMACDDFEDLYDEINGWKFVSGTTSSHQQVDYYYNEEKKDACLFLEDYLHACLSNRPHYHEVFVHYPAHFLEKVERVLFIGGGDSMVLHEVLKYDQLELVVGLELDQHVVRSTFAQMGTQPHFHNDKVEWWFGDAAVALNALQTEYYGTFDLVVVDILSEVAESLQVTKNVTIMEAAMMLMKPNGIIVKNEDEGYVPGSTNSTTFTEYTTDVVYYDVPVYCLQTFVMGSNTVDFSKAEPTDHKVSNFYIKGVDEFQSQFDTWYTSGTVAKGEEDAKVENNDDSSSEEESTVSPSIIGVVMIIEAEEISITLDSPSDVMEIINETLRAIGFTVIKSYDRELLDGYTLISLLEEGCITARCFTDEEYCAMDVQLWKSAHRVELVKKEMLLALESEESSVYRIVTTGIYGLEENNSNPKIGPPPKKTAFRQRSVPKDDENTQPKIQTTFKKREDPTIDFKNATTDDYDSTSALAQWKSQEPFGFQGLTKFNLPFEYDKKRLTYMLVDVLTKALSMLLKEWENQDKDQIIVEPYDVGDGLVVVATWSEGNILFVWDGADRVDMTIFSLEDSGVLSLKLVREYFRKYLEPIEKDEFPRGTGRVINHRNVFGLEDEDEDEDEEEDEERSHPFWAP